MKFSHGLIISRYSYHFFSFYDNFCNYTSKEKRFKIKIQTKINVLERCINSKTDNRTYDTLVSTSVWIIQNEVGVTIY